jgi:PKHD-type hydroxylase
MNQIWQFWKTGITSNQADLIIEAGNQQPVAEVGLGFDGSTQNNQYRSSEIRWLPTALHPDTTNLLWAFAQTANRNAFGFDIAYLNDIQYTTYHANKNGKYDWHHDTFWGNPTAFDRKISIVMQLSDPKDYEGGDFEIDPQYQALPAEDIRTKGAVIAFPSFIRHRVTPVTKGVRRSLVCWVEGPKFR